MTPPPSARAVQWRGTGEGEFQYEADVDGEKWRVRVNDFPAEPMYTLFIGDAEAETLEGWPPAWTRPA